MLPQLIREYFPDLTAEQVKYVIDKSATPVTEKVILPGTQKTPGDDEEPTMVNLSDISITGGEVNAYEAVKLAATIKGEKDKEMKLPKSKVRRERND